jgi:transcriptional regulator with XRE-family HTH domain
VKKLHKRKEGIMNKIKYYREKRELKQEELANLILVDRSTVAKWENGDAYPRADKLPNLAKVLRCTIDDLFC